MDKINNCGVKYLVLALVFIGMVSFAACGKNSGDISKVQVNEWETSNLYTDSDIESAIQTAEDYFSSEFGGCTLTTIGYAGDDSEDEAVEWAEQYGADEAIILEFSFSTGYSVSDGFEADTVYTGWEWILIRDDGGSWRYATHGDG
ncbi:MAG: hypothetical protein LUD01_09355 [Clostridiales bacterium]|nr:hypothetical protein [Clostridiales bacterium]